MTNQERAKRLADNLGIETYGIEGQLSVYIGGGITEANECFIPFIPFEEKVHFAEADIMIGMITRGLIAKGLRVKLDLSMNLALKKDFVVFINKPYTTEFRASMGEDILAPLAEAAYQVMEAENASK